MSPRYAPLALHEEHYQALLILARNRGYSSEYAEGMNEIREAVHDLSAKAILSN